MLYTNKKCNEPEESDNSVFLLDELNIFSDIHLYTNINQAITRKKILNGIDMLKNNKACGDARIFEICIKSTQDFMLNFYTGFILTKYDTHALSEW